MSCGVSLLTFGKTELQEKTERDLSRVYLVSCLS